MRLMAFDLGGTSVKYGTYVKDELIDKGSFITPATLEELMEKMTTVIDKQEKIEGIAISAPGSVNQKDRVIEGISAIPYIHFTPIYDLFEKEFGLPVAIENDANCAGLCEVDRGAAKNGENIVFFVLGTGMGGSVFINRQLHTGSHMYGGEFGMSLNSNGETGSKNGTLVAAAKKYNEQMGTNLDGIQLLDLYDQGQAEAVKTIDQMFNAIAEILYNVQVIIDPDTIVLGGGISNRSSLSEELAVRMDKHLEELDILGAKPKIVNAQYRNDANLYGAVINYKKQIESLL
ncbi:Sugar kinase of the NBD/HSP70 family, may contain an N-terminal HTH domain [Atopostipes suicloacalis DSM 15692]|uniref:Sugar kinase of the NBD/HSP70 family, may contain an N-terminal HTH domain n=1 Tax=Atopostipes suicloacalis DSM 15692 TaxID=1121025 RepID=A0A1M4UFX5_9LACT|nr:ROK family protein [Atopostipes suicloacalis]SHE55567.1 Sugar kinase of the NBD/HSP70 family, may contain an N-terminal HTH domain [Atopostipes suicloacalis DSM 15692]